MSQSAGADTRNKLIEAGKRVIYEKGYHSARVSDITAAAGLAHGTFYLYFRTKEDFLLELMKSVREGLLNLMEEGIALIRRGKSDEGKERFFLKTFELMMEEKELAKILFFEAICSSGVFQRFYSESTEMFLRRTREVLELLEFPSAEIRSHILVGTARHLVELLILKGEEVSGKWKEVLRELGICS